MMTLMTCHALNRFFSGVLGLGFTDGEAAAAEPCTYTAPFVARDAFLWLCNFHGVLLPMVARKRIARHGVAVSFA